MGSNLTNKLRKGGIAMNIWKIIIVSAVVSANIIIWYEVFGDKFLVMVAIGIIVLVLGSRTNILV